MSDSPDQSAATAAPASGEDAPYRVLARKYRPAAFADLIGQEAMVRTLSNAIAAGRVPHAFILTGVRGVGKTTTARIIARALNCIGSDGAVAGPTAEPCGVCEHCTAIAQDRHVDVIEMDAASRTGIDDIRDLIDGVRYRPVSARNKVYIVDEVHMLSRQAFNGLLKTLEEPPEHVVFIFATTEIRKVPVTVLSRCMRFDLRRVEQAELERHFGAVCGKEGVSVEPQALSMIVRAADGSVRDGLSLLDQAIALSGDQVGEAQVKEMLGLADRARIYDLYDAALRGQAAEALDVLAELYAAGADPAVVLQDLLEVTHRLTRLKLVPDGAETAGLPEVERVRGREMAEAVTTAQLARNWQILLKGLGEAQQAPQPLQAAEMVLIRLMHAGELPTPGDLVKRLQGDAGSPRAAQPAAAAPAVPEGAPQGAAVSAGAQPGPQPAPQESPAEVPEAQDHVPQPRTLSEVVALCRERGEPRLAAHLRNDVHPVRLEPGVLEIRPGENAPRDLAGRLGRLLQDWTGRRWVVSLSQEPGEAPLAAQEREAEAMRREAVMQHPAVQAVLETFPGAQLVAVRGGAEDIEASPAAAEAPAAEEQETGDESP